MRPTLGLGATIQLTGSRHPVVEAISRNAFVPNDVGLDAEGRQVVILTGPNMGGKSTYLRQVALAAIMARAGSFVAAERAEIGEIDRVFTRVGAADDIARGESTFMVEMTEVANILRHATRALAGDPRRGGSRHGDVRRPVAGVGGRRGAARRRGHAAGPLVLFATHYHELTDLASRLPRVVNVSVAVKEWQGHVLFLHRVVPGPSDRSYGIHVARLAGVPAGVCGRAEEVLRTLERQELRVLDEAQPEAAPRQLPLFPAPAEAVIERLRGIDVDALTPLDALNLLAALRREIA